MNLLCAQTEMLACVRGEKKDFNDRSERAALVKVKKTPHTQSVKRRKESHFGSMNECV